MELDPGKYYKLLVRPVVVITTLFENGKVNAAPFSFTTPLSFSPPLFAFATSTEHDTYKNVKRTGEFVANLVGNAIGPYMKALERPLPEGESELDLAGLETRKSRMISTPGMADAYAWIECKLHADVECGDHNLIIGKVLAVDVVDKFWDRVVVPEKASPLFHISGEYFGRGVSRVKYERWR